LVHAMAHRNSAHSLARSDGKARTVQELDVASVDRCILLVAAWHVLSALGYHRIRARVCERSEPRSVHPRVPGTVHRDCARLVCMARTAVPLAGGFCADLARELPAAQQRAARSGDRPDLDRHALSDVPRCPRARQDLGWTALFHDRILDPHAAARVDARTRHARLMEACIVRT